MADRVNWGVLGNALIARKCVIPAIQKSRNGRVHCLATRSPQSAEEVVETNKIEQVYDNYEAVLADSAVEAVYIPLPNHLHCPWTLKALSAGKHVLCEKPLACDVQEARMMADRATASGKLLMEAFMYRFHPRSRRIKQIVEEGGIGNPCLIRSAFCFHMDDKILRSGKNIRLKPTKGGGALMDVGLYLQRFRCHEPAGDADAVAAYIHQRAPALARLQTNVLAASDNFVIHVKTE